MKKLILSLLLTIALATAATVNYSYDAAGRLVKIDYGSGGSITYTYDNAGNLLSRTAVSAAQLAERQSKKKPVANDPDKSRPKPDSKDQKQPEAPVH